MIETLRHALSFPLLSGVVLALLGFSLTFLLIPLIIGRVAPLVAGARHKEFHQTHKTPVPRLGGIALAATFALIAPVVLVLLAPEADHLKARITITLTALAMFGLGIWDDISPLGAKKKLLGQILIATVASYCGLEMERVRNPITGTLYELGWLDTPATVFWLVALTNLINLVDGIDGLAGGISLMLMCLLGFVGFNGHSYSYFIAMGLAGALLAFLRYNFPPARIYLGDGGAYFLGYLIGALTIQNSNKGTIAAALVAPIFALALPILDVTFSIFRRGLKGLPIFRPDRRHIHHRLLQSGLSRKRAVLTLYAISMIFLAIAFVAFMSNGRHIGVLFGSIFLVLLVAAPSLGIIRNWLTVGTAVGNSIEMRKEVQYALLLRNWLELEAERCDSVEELCEDLQFIGRKLGFTEVTLLAHTERRTWRALDSVSASERAVRHELHLPTGIASLQLTAPSDMDERRFQLLSELIAEAWLHASKRWQAANKGPFALQQRSDGAQTLSAANAAADAALL